jgi:hypothetical protein
MSRNLSVVYMGKLSMDKYGRQTIVPAGSDWVNVVPFENYKHEGDSETLREIERYWLQLRGSFLLPQSGNLKAEDLKPYLSNIFIADKIAPGLVQIKTAGPGISASLGMDPRGMPLSALFWAQARGPLASAVHATLDTPEVTRLSLHAATNPLMPAIAAKMLLLPLLNNQPEPNRIFGVLTCSCSKTNDRPRFEITKTQSYPLDLTLNTPTICERVTVNTGRYQSTLGTPNDQNHRSNPNTDRNIILLKSPIDKA